ncbi:MAG: tyrosine-type recombinase/integrase [Halobacteriaceae archaeon]
MMVDGFRNPRCGSYQDLSWFSVSKLLHSLFFFQTDRDFIRRGYTTLFAPPEMAEKDNSDPSKLPKKLQDRIEDADFGTVEKVIGEDDEEILRSDHPVGVVEYYLRVVRQTAADATIADLSYDLTRFLEFCEYAGIEDLSELSSRSIEGFKTWREKDGNITLVTLHAQLCNIRVFFRFCERAEIIQEGLADKIELPDLDDSDSVSYVRLSADEAEAILDHYEQFGYATRRHVAFLLAWETLLRLGDMRAIDLRDYKKDEDGAYIELHHREDEDTPLKNQENTAEQHGGERELNVPDWMVEIIDDYIAENRIEKEDAYGREPLLTTRYGRVGKSTLRRDLYRMTQPCRYGKGCPHDKDPADCEARNNNDRLSRCPDCVSPHPVRRGGICHQLNQGVTKEMICERADVSRKVLNKHYDLRTKEEARKQRREALRESLDGYGDDLESSKQETTQHGILQSESPLIADAVAALDRCMSLLDQSVTVPSRDRAAKGAVAYAGYVVLTGIDLGLMGIGIDPATLSLILP